MNSNRVRTLIKKDLRETLGTKMVMLPMIIVPIVMAMIMPVAIILPLAFGNMDMMNGVAQIEKLVPAYPIPGRITELPQQILYIFLNYTFLPMFLIIPLMVASIIAANSVVGEKERGTLETLLYTPITNREFIFGKLAGAFLPGVLIALPAFLLYAGISNILGLHFFGILLVSSPIWIPTLLLLSPAISLLGLGITLFVSIKSKTFMEAQQVSAMVVLPLVMLMIAQLTGLLIINTLYLIGIAAALFLLDYLLIVRLIPRFNREAVLSRL
jgi:ABC-type Na+ efflux pump permease subunit